ncbi:MAG: polyprenyl synthetase family protein, partial [Draconibacterium sp.]|nr:polyprenyl synthetase family protein [Draconibacterium sp.]
ETFGKKIGGDILANKKTYLLISALENANGLNRVELLKWIEKKEFDSDEKIEAVKQIFIITGAQKIVSDKIDFYFKKAMEILDKIPLDDVLKQNLRRLADKMLTRRH